MKNFRRRSVMGLTGALEIVAAMAPAAHAVSWGVSGPGGSCAATGATHHARGARVVSTNCTTVRAEVTAIDEMGRPSTVFGPRQGAGSEVIHPRTMVTQRAGTAWIGTTSARQTW